MTLSNSLARRRRWLRTLVGICLAAVVGWTTMLTGGSAAGLPISGSGLAAGASSASGSLPNKGTLITTLAFTLIPNQATIPRPVGLPGAPTQLTATPAGTNTVTLSWDPPAADGGPPVTSYNIYQGTAPGAESGTPVATVTDTATGTPATTATAAGLKPGTTYYFKVTAASKPGGEGPPSEEARAAQATIPGPAAPGPPTKLIILLAAVILAAAGIATAAHRRRLRSRPPAAPAPIVRAVPDTGPPGLVSVHNTGTGVTHTVRIQPSPGTSITTIKEARP